MTKQNHGEKLSQRERLGQKVDATASADPTKVNIRPNVSILSVLRHLNYKPWFALAEFVDNSLQSAIESLEELRKIHGKGYRLTVSIETSPHDGGFIIIRDNAAGIAMRDFPRAFKAAELPLDRTGLSEFGMGMKSAALWFADKWKVRTKALGENAVRTVSFDVKSILAERREELDINSEAAAADAHFTEIVLEQLAVPLPPKIRTRIRDHLASIFRVFIRDGRLVLKFDGEELAHRKPAVMKAPYFKGPSSKTIIWEREIDFDFGQGQRVWGFAALFDVASTSRAGFALFRRDRLIEGSFEEGWRPEHIFGKPNDYTYQRLFGELHLEGFDVTHTKDGFKWREYEEVFLDLLKGELDHESLPLIKQAEGHRVRNRPDDYTKGASAASGRTASDMEEHVPPVIESQMKKGTDEPLAVPLPALGDTPTTRQVRFKADGRDWLITLELTSDYAIGDWLSLEGGVPIRGNTAMEVKVRLSLVHPFMQRFGGVSASQIEPLLRVAAAIALAEVTARASGVKHAGILRQNINDFLRNGLIDPDIQ